MKRVLVIGATGNIGREVVSQLLATDCRVRAMTRHPDRERLPRQVEVAGCDLADAEGLERCLDGVDMVFLVWTAPVEAAAAAVTRIATHAERVVFLSSPHKTPHPFFQQPNSVRGVHEELERLITESGLRWTFLRPGMFAGNSLIWWAPQIRAGDVVRWPYAAAPTAPIHERDIAAVAVRALIESRHDREEYVLTGPESLTQVEQVMMIGEVLGRQLRFEEITPDEARDELPAPPPIITMLLDAWAAALGQPAYVTSTVEAITGKPARTFREWVFDHANQFQA
jgi:uncharacterized protein YbjT (DUF2867 family)